jgi:hypothetical protein
LSDIVRDLTSTTAKLGENLRQECLFESNANIRVRDVLLGNGAHFNCPIEDDPTPMACYLVGHHFLALAAKNISSPCSAGAEISHIDMGNEKYNSGVRNLNFRSNI